MAGIDPFELIGKLKNARTDLLVDVLRRLHNKGSGDLSAIDQLLDGNVDPTANASPKPSAPGAANAGNERYEELRRHFVPYAEQLRQQAVLTEKLLKGFASEPKGPTPSVLQQEIRIQASPGTQSGARFAVVNSLDHATELTFRAGSFHGLSDAQRDSLRMEFEPKRPQLGPNEERWIHVRVEVADIDGLPDRIETGVDLLGGDRLLLKLWIQVELRARKSGNEQSRME